MEQRFTFNGIAALYAAVRPEYPDALFDDLAAFAGLGSGDEVLEVGCGAGQATLGFARRGCRMLALEPGPAMIEAARERLAAFPDVRFMQTTFEAWPPQPAAYKLVAAAQSWHWVDPQIRFVKAASTLQADGALAVFGNVLMSIVSPLREAFARVYAREAPHLEGKRSGDWYLPDGPFAAMFEQSGLFSAVAHSGYPWSRDCDASGYANLMRTWSEIQLLEPAPRERLLAGLAEAIDAQGGAFELRYEAHLYVAKAAR
ncbi:MAG: class I SAM-dependent methyltransferase [Roseiarcus sp.]